METRLTFSLRVMSSTLRKNRSSSWLDEKAKVLTSSGAALFLSPGVEGWTVQQQAYNDVRYV